MILVDLAALATTPPPPIRLPPAPDAARGYVYRWDRHGRKGQPCKVTTRGLMNSIRVEFADGYAMVTSANAIRRAMPE